MTQVTYEISVYGVPLSTWRSVPEFLRKQYRTHNSVLRYLHKMSGNDLLCKENNGKLYYFDNYELAQQFIDGVFANHENLAAINLIDPIKHQIVYHISR